MAILFPDTSALAKRYVQEQGTLWLQNQVDPQSGNRVIVAAITRVEITAAISRRERGGTLSSADANSSRNLVRQDFLTEYEIVPITEALLDEAVLLSETHGLRGYDAVQLAAAVQTNMQATAVGLPPLLLLSADAELNAAATAEGLQVDNPNNYP